MPNQPDLAGLRIRMVRFPSWGLHTPYSITITEDGLLVYKERDRCDKRRFTTVLSQTRLKNLLNAFLQIEFFSLKDKYPEDGEIWLDTGATIVFLKWNGTSKKVRDIGIRSPPGLAKLQVRIERLAGAEPYCGRKPKNAKPLTE